MAPARRVICRPCKVYALDEIVSLHKKHVNAGRLESFFGAATVKSSTKRKEPETKGKAGTKSKKAANAKK